MAQHLVANVTQHFNAQRKPHKNRHWKLLFSLLLCKTKTRKNTQGPSRARRLLTNAFNRADSQKYGGHHEKTLLLSSNHTNSLLSTASARLFFGPELHALSLTPTTTNNTRPTASQPTPLRVKRTLPCGMILQFFFFFQNFPHKNNASYATGPIMRLHTILPNTRQIQKFSSTTFFALNRLTFHTTLHRTLRAPSDDDDSGRGGNLDIFNLFFHKRFNDSVFRSVTTRQLTVAWSMNTTALHCIQENRNTTLFLRFVEFGVSLISTPSSIPQ